jgi:hypothetical protein
LTNCKNRDATVASLEGADVSSRFALLNPVDETIRHDETPTPVSASSTVSQPIEVFMDIIPQVAKKQPDKHEEPNIANRLPVSTSSTIPQLIEASVEIPQVEMRQPDKREALDITTRLPVSTPSTVPQLTEVSVELPQVEIQQPDKHETPASLNRLPAVVQVDGDKQQSAPLKQDLSVAGRQQGASHVSTVMRPKEKERASTDGPSGPTDLKLGEVGGGRTAKSASKGVICNECGKEFSKEQMLRAHKVVSIASS